MKITILYDNTTMRKDLEADWGFAALVEAHGRRLLFDTGASGSILLSNMKTLLVDPGTIDDVFISHPDFDHIGGLSAFLDRNSNVTVWVPQSLHGVKKAKEVIKIDGARKMHEGLFTTGELEEIEQSLCVETENGIVIIAGCSHPRLDHIIEAASTFGPVYGIVGGLHGNTPEYLKNLRLICATHCTIHKKEIAFLFQDRYIEGGAGKVIEVMDNSAAT